MTVEQASIKLAVAGLTGLIGMATGVSIPATSQALALFNEIRDRNRRRAARNLATAAAEEIDALRSREYAREPDSGIFASALATAADTLDRHRLTSAEFLRLQLQPERAADAVLAHAPFNRLDGDTIPATARRILVCFYAKLRAEKDLLEEVVPDVYGEIMRQGETLHRVAAQGERIEQLVQQPPVIDVGLVLAIAEHQGYLSPEKAKALEEQVARTQRDLERIRAVDPDWRAEVDAAIEAFNRSDIDAAKAAFARIDALIAERRAELTAQERELRQEEARSKHAQATLFYPFEASRSEPLLTQAAELAETDFRYWIECGRARWAIGSLERAAAAFQTARDLAEASDSERDLGVALHDLGFVRVAQGDLTGALDAYERSKAIAEKLAAADPGNANWQSDLSLSRGKIGDVRRVQGDLTGALEAYTESHLTADKLAAADPGNARWLRDLSVSWNRIGDVLVTQGYLAGAGAAYGARHVIAETLATADPSNAGWQHDLSASWNRIGTLRLAQSDIKGAVAAYGASHNILGKLAAVDPGNARWQRDLSVSCGMIGDVRRAQGDLAGALDAYTATHGILEKLAAADPSNAEWQRDLSVSWNRIGDVRVAQSDLAAALDAYGEAKAIAEKLAAADPGNTEWQRDLSVSWIKIGDVRVAQGDLVGALDAYGASHAIAEMLAAADPGNAEWQRDLSASWNRIGDVRTAQGDLTGALDAYGASHDIFEKLAAADPSNAEWQRDLIVSHVKLSGLAAENADARAHLTAALEIARALEQTGRLAPVDAWMPADLEQRLAALDK